MRASALQMPHFTQTVRGELVRGWGGGVGGGGEWGGGVPAMGGKRMAISPRNMSLLHMVWVLMSSKKKVDK